MTAPRVIHHSVYAFPLDRHFYGQTYVLMGHLLNTGLPTTVVSKEGSDDGGLNRRLVETHTSSTVVFDDYRGAISSQAAPVRIAREIEDARIGVRTVERKLVGLDALLASVPEGRHGALERTRTKIGDELVAAQEKLASRELAHRTSLSVAESLTTGTYFSLVDQGIQEHGNVALVFHYFGSELSNIGVLKTRYGDRIKAVLHLHCMPELYFGPASSTATASNHRDNIKHFTRLEKEGKIDGYVAVSQAVKDAFVRDAGIPAHKISVIPNGVSDALYMRYGQEQKDAFRRGSQITAETLVGYVGRMEPVKGSEVLFEVLRHYEQSGGDCAFVFATSNGEDRQRFVERAEHDLPGLIQGGKLKLMLDVGKLTNGNTVLNAEVVQHFQQQLAQEGIWDHPICGGILTTPLQPNLDIYVQASRSEAISLSILEALMSGVPVVASRVGGIPEIVNHNNGRLVEIADQSDAIAAERFVEAIENVRERIRGTHTDTYLRITRQNLIDAGYTAKRMAKELDDFYTKR